LWACPDGRDILFGRDYRPLIQRRNGVVSPADPREWVVWKWQGLFFLDATQPDRCRPTRAKLLLVLDEFWANRSVDRFIEWPDVAIWPSRPSKGAA
jgi:hypothetical protein